VSAADAVTVSIEVAVAPTFAFEVFTEDLDAWWGYGPRYRFVSPYTGVMKLEPGVGGRLLHVHDEATGEAFVVGRVRAWDPPERLVFSWRLANFAPAQDTEVEVRFQPVAAGTRVTVTHRGWDGIPPGHPARHGQVDRAFVLFKGRWWADLLAAAKRHAEQADRKPEPGGGRP
jgi:uncharacterized protein YndB with AHSA1/START domain